MTDSEQPPRTVAVGLVQMSCDVRPADNLEKAAERIRQAAERGAQIVCLQELFRTRYFCQSAESRRFQLGEPIPGPTSARLTALAAELGVVLVAPIFEKRAPGLFHNTALVIDADGTLVGTYRKMHIPDDPLYCEKFYFTPGDLGFQTFETRYARIGVLICWDQWFPEGARLTALSGAQILFYPTAIGWQQADTAEEQHAQRQAWEIVQRGHAVANGVYLVAVNRVGPEDKLRFWGASFVCGPFGRILQQASETEEETLVVDCDLTRIDQTRQDWPFLRDRRTDAYDKLNQRYLD